MSEQIAGLGERGVQHQSIVTDKNVAVTQLFCGKSDEWLRMMDVWYKAAGTKKNVKCLCKNGQNGDPSWKKSCSWSFNEKKFQPGYLNEVTCKPAEAAGNKIYRYERVYSDLVVYPHYELNIDLNLDDNPHKEWSNIIAFHDPSQPSVTDNGYTVGGRIPAVFVKPGENKLHICTAIEQNGNACWNSEEFTPGKWFNLKIKQQYELNQYVYKIFINGELQYQRVNSAPGTFPNVTGRLGHAYEPERNYHTSSGMYRNLRFKTHEAPKYCIKVTSGDGAGCANHPRYNDGERWFGKNPVDLVWTNKHGSTVAAELGPQKTELEWCLNVDMVDIENDIFSLSATSNDGVCITSMTVDNKQMLTGKNNDQRYFWIDDNDGACSNNHMSTDRLEIQNGEVVYSHCDHQSILKNHVRVEDVTVHNEFELEFELELGEQTDRWSNILGFEQQGELEDTPGRFDVGRRVPAVFRHANSNRLHICMAINDNGNKCWNSQELNIGEWYDVKIRQAFLINENRSRYEFYYQIYINEELQHQWVNNQPRVFHNVNGVYGNTYGSKNYAVTNGKIRNFAFESFPPPTQQPPTQQPITK